MKNKLSDLNNHLFEQLERLNDEDLSGDDLNEEIERSRAITDVAKTIINNGELVLRAQKQKDEYYGTRPGSFPAMLITEDKELTKSGLLVAKVILKAAERKNELKRRKKK